MNSLLRICLTGGHVKEKIRFMNVCIILHLQKLQVGITKKCTLKKFSSTLKEENKLNSMQFLSNLQEKNKITFTFLYAIKILNFLLVIQDKKNSFG
jgi:hypothetical protein